MYIDVSFIILSCWGNGDIKFEHSLPIDLVYAEMTIFRTPHPIWMSFGESALSQFYQWQSNKAAILTNKLEIDITTMQRELYGSPIPISILLHQKYYNDSSYCQR